MHIAVAKGSFWKFGSRVIRTLSHFDLSLRQFSSQYNTRNGFGPIEELLGENQEYLDLDQVLDGFEAESNNGNNAEKFIYSRRRFLESSWRDADRAFQILRQEGPGFDLKAALNELKIRVSGLFIREVLLKILRTANSADKTWCAKLGYLFFMWSTQQEGYVPTVNLYHLLMQIFAEAKEYKAMWRLVDDMTQRGCPTTARTLHILLCTCGEAGLARKVVEKFTMSKTFSYRPFKHAYNAVLHTLLSMNHFKLIERVYEQMLAEGHSPDVLTYNIIMCAKFKLGKTDQFNRLFDEMGRNGFSPDIHTFNILLHVLGKADKPYAALDLLTYMRQVGVDPTVLHFTTLIDGLCRAGNLDACRYFFDEMIHRGAEPDVVCYTVLITGYVSAGELENAQRVFDEMVVKGQLPNVFTYNSLIRGLCMAGKFEEACSMLKEMEERGCRPNFLVYNTLVTNLRSSGKLSEAHDIIRHMIERGHYTHLLSKFKRYRGW